MKMQLFLSWLFTILISSNSFFAQEINVSQENVKLQKNLEEIGSNFDVFFTIEKSESDPGRIEEKLVKNLKGRKLNLKEALSEIQDNLPGYCFVQNDKDKKIFHFIEKSLLETKDYPCNFRLREINFSGDTERLINFLKEKKIPIKERDSFSTDQLFLLGKKFPFQIKETDIELRSFLSFGIPVSDRNRLIWTSRYSGKSKILEIWFCPRSG